MTWSLACLGKSTVLGRALFLPKRNDMIKTEMALEYQGRRKEFNDAR